MEQELETQQAMDVATPWMQIVGEPSEWYDKFIAFYIPLGPARTILKAFTAYAKATSPEQAILMTASPPTTAPHSWSQFSNQYQWRKRAVAWDAEQVKGAAENVLQARGIIQAATVEAAMTLRQNLKNPKLSNQAAKEILDRGGVPTVTVHNVRTVTFTSDELAQAARELDEWNQVSPQQLLNVPSTNSPE